MKCCLFYSAIHLGDRTCLGSEKSCKFQDFIFIQQHVAVRTAQKVNIHFLFERKSDINSFRASGFVSSVCLQVSTEQVSLLRKNGDEEVAKGEEGLIQCPFPNFLLRGIYIPPSEQHALLCSRVTNYPFNLSKARVTLIPQINSSSSIKA